MLKCVYLSYCNYKIIRELDEENSGIKWICNKKGFFVCKTFNSGDQIFLNL